MQPEYDDDDIQKKVNDEGFSPQKFGGGGAGDDSDKRFVMRNGIRFEKRSSTSKARNPNTMPATIPNTGGNSFFSRLMSSRSSANSQTNNVAAPDEDFCADSLIKLSHGITAYRLIEPSTVDDENADTIPVIVCLHGQYNCSYMWADVVDLLCDCERGPNARVLVFDFYGRGRSPWTGVPITLDVLVVQTKELLDLLGLIQFPVSLIGFDMGGAVATGFAAKYPDMCQSLTLIGSLGCKYKLLDHEPLLKRKYIGEIMMYRRRATIANYMESEVFDGRPDSPHRPLVDKHIAMMQWQIANTPGYLGALLSGFRLFPLRGMEELFTAIGRYNRPVLVIWGDKDVVCPYKKSIAIMERSFPSGYIVDIRDCGHNPITEKFNETMTEILSFHKMIFDAINKLAAQQNHDFNDSFFQNV